MAAPVCRLGDINLIIFPASRKKNLSTSKPHQNITNINTDRTLTLTSPARIYLRPHINQQNETHSSPPHRYFPPNPHICRPTTAHLNQEYQHTERAPRQQPESLIWLAASFPALQDRSSVMWGRGVVGRLLERGRREARKLRRGSLVVREKRWGRRLVELREVFKRRCFWGECIWVGI